MEIHTATKKKKRRTRKCLDEIRKRSRRTMWTDYFGQTSQKREKNNRADERPTPRLITMNRLTLKKNPKVIRSETITRPILEEIKQKSSLNNKLDSDKNINYIDLSKVECSENCNSATSNSMPMFDMEGVSLHAHVSNHSDNQLKNYQNLHSPIHVGVTQTPTEIRAKAYTTSHSSQTSDGDHIHELYEELMNKISSHLKTVTSTIIREDVIETAKENLQKLYNKNWSKEYKTATKHEKNNKSTESPKDGIVQNPLDYLKHSYVQQQGMHNCHLGLSDVFSLTLSPAAAPVKEILHSSLSFKTECIRDITLYDTPEYNYYPHRLNQ